MIFRRTAHTRCRFTWPCFREDTTTKCNIRVVSSCLHLRRLSEHISSSENKNTHSDKDRMWSLARIVAKRLCWENIEIERGGGTMVGLTLHRDSWWYWTCSCEKKDCEENSWKEEERSCHRVGAGEKCRGVRCHRAGEHVVIPEEILPKNDVVFSPEKYRWCPDRRSCGQETKKEEEQQQRGWFDFTTLAHILSLRNETLSQRCGSHLRCDGTGISSRLQILEKFNGKKTLDGSHSSQARVLFRSIRSSRKKNRYYDSVISHKNSKMGAHMMFTDFLRLLGCLADLCSKQVCARPCAHCCASNVRDNITDQILLHACMAMSRSEDGTICNVDSKYVVFEREAENFIYPSNTTIVSLTYHCALEYPNIARLIQKLRYAQMQQILIALRARTQVHEEFEQVLRFLHRHVFPNASSRSRSKILGQNATERGIIIEETRNTLPIVLQAALAPLFTKFCKFENSFFAVLHTGGYYLSPKDSSNINSTRTMFWPQFLALCEHVRIIPALHVRDVAHAFLSASKRKYHVTKKTQISEMSQVFVTHELTYNTFFLLCT